MLRPSLATLTAVAVVTAGCGGGSGDDGDDRAAAPITLMPFDTDLLVTPTPEDLRLPRVSS
jgi:hypothetical protein